MAEKLPAFQSVSTKWPAHLELLRRWGLQIGSSEILRVRVAALWMLWPARPWWIGVNAYAAEDDQEPWNVLYVPLALYAETVAALTPLRPHRVDAFLTEALGFAFVQPEDFAAAFEGLWIDPSADVLAEVRRHARLHTATQD